LPARAAGPDDAHDVLEGGTLVRPEERPVALSGADIRLLHQGNRFKGLDTRDFFGPNPGLIESLSVIVAVRIRIGDLLRDQRFFTFPSCRNYDLTALRASRYLISMKVEQAAAQLEALGKPTRLKVYRALVRAGDEGLPVGRLQKKLGIAGSTLSHHLHRLISTGLVTQERQVTTLICRANYPAMDSLVSFLVDECCVESGGADGDAEAAA
jgi:DNA-binding transcriptional ArsR family regulator